MEEFTNFLTSDNSFYLQNTVNKKSLRVLLLYLKRENVLKCSVVCNNNLHVHVLVGQGLEFLFG